MSFIGIHYKVHCAENFMRVELFKRDEVKNIYLQHLKDFPGDTHKLDK